MIPLIRRLKTAFLYDELAVTRWLRGLVLLLGGGGIAFADQLAGILGEGASPGFIKGIRVASLVCLFAGGAITAGEKNPKTDDHAAARVGTVPPVTP